MFYLSSKLNRLLLFMVTFSLGGVAYGETSSSAEESLRAESSEPTISEERLVQYIRLGFIKQLPAIRPKNNFKTSSDLGLNIGLEYEYQKSWLLSFDLKISNLENPQLNFDEVAFFTLQQSVKYLFRIYYPVYLMLGYDFGIMYVARRMRAPPEAHPDFKTKSIFGLNTGVLWKFSDVLRFHVNISRWRGLDGDKLHGYEFLIGSSYRI